jgi:aspartate/methionine/tyrosine aminotransferase
MSLFSDQIGLLGSENAFKIGPLIKKAEELLDQKIIRCNLGEPDFKTPAFIKEEVKRQLDNDNTHYVDPQGILSLREAIAKHTNETHKLSVTAEQVVVFPGGKPPIGFCEQVYLNPGDEIIYPSPGYPIYESFAKYVKAVPVPLHLSEEKGFSFDGEDLAKLITPKTKMIILNFPSNPTGGVASLESLTAIAEVIKEKCNSDVRIYSDEIYEDIVFDGAKSNSIASIAGMSERTIIVNGVSKNCSWTGGRVGWAILPTVEEAQVLKNLNINYFSCVSAYNQEGARVALESPQEQEFINEMKTAFQERRDLVVAGLNEIEGIKCQLPKGAFYVFPNISGVCEQLGILAAYDSLADDLKKRTTPSTLFQMFLLFKYGVATMDRKAFGSIGQEGKHYLRLSIATAKTDLQEAVERIKKASTDKTSFQEFLNKGEYLFY